MQRVEYLGALVADLVGTPFVDRGRDPATGLDCWGLVMEVQRRLGRAIPDYLSSAFDPRETDARMHEATGPGGDWLMVPIPHPGDVVCMNLEKAMPELVQHFGVYLGRHRFIHVLEGRNCEISTLHDLAWNKRMRGFGRWAK